MPEGPTTHSHLLDVNCTTCTQIAARQDPQHQECAAPKQSFSRPGKGSASMPLPPAALQLPRDLGSWRCGS
eukprot:CAMPEP_0183441234 /NCGR_PEP_ID=MMETSP0370-20130417/84098_1 /TAXON_ID=268820 /ORGANISM="Peridinium aciculiferum, Strain PAER-2" /LENGTH=70 /DNA_ID=CAMNT_0025630365 /DNA_START=22 /DNA_END=231 /DNA_ORIENTATION=+